MTQPYYIKSLSGVSVLILTVTNIFLTVRLLHSKNCTSSYPSNAIKDKLIPEAPRITSKTCLDYEIQDNNNNNIPEHDDDDRSKVHVDFEIGRWDNQHLYKFYDFIIVGTKFAELSQKYTVCLATQSSVEKLYSLVQVSEHWNGPISIGIFTAGDEEFTILQYFLNYLRNCYTSVREKVSVHLAVPKEKIPGMYKNNLGTGHRRKIRYFDSNNCASPEIILRRLLKLRTPEIIKWRQKHPYPQNHMRNLARKGCQTSNIFLTDVDIIPSINFTKNVDKFLKTNRCNGLCAYVVPTYEIDFRVKFPINKSDLIRLVSKGLARPFHEKVFIYNQFATNFSRWQKDVSSDIDTHISHNVTNFEFLYEPFYISSDRVPIHDERFLGYGFTRNSQVYEMYIAGYTFQVLTPVFTCHWGLQQKKTRPAWREQQNNVNRKHFEKFKKEILIRYNKEPTI